MTKPRSRMDYLRRLTEILFIGFVVYSPVMATAQSFDVQEERCEYNDNKYPPESVVEACTWLLDSGSLPEDKTAAVYTNRGKAWYDSGNVNRAIDDFDTALRLDPDQENAFAARAFAYIAVGRSKQAQMDLVKIVEETSLDPAMVLLETARELASTVQRHRHGRLAVLFAEQAVASMQDNPEAYEVLAAAHAANSRFDAAIRAQEKAIALAGTSAPDELPGYNARLTLYKRKEPLFCPGTPACW